MPLVLVVLLTLLGAPARADTPGVVGQLEQSATTSPKEKVAFSEAAVLEIGGAVKTVEKLLDEATKQKNTEEIECLTRKLTPLKALLEVSKASNTAMQSALASSDAVHADQEFRKIAVALTKSRDFLAEAQACVGDAGAKRGNAAITVVEGEGSLVDETDLAGAEGDDPQGAGGSPQ
jgi:hypothetical protein